MRSSLAVAVAIVSGAVIACATGQTLDSEATGSPDGGALRRDAGSGSSGAAGASTTSAGGTDGTSGGAGAAGATTGVAGSGAGGDTSSGGRTSGGGGASGGGSSSGGDTSAGGSGIGGASGAGGGSGAGGAAAGGVTGTGGAGTGGAGTGGAGTGGAGTGGAGTGGTGTGGAGGTCADTEICNGVDDDGDGLVDEPSSVNTAACRGCTAVQRNGFAYWFCTTTKDRSPAETDCVAKGGHLASIHDQAENDFVSTTMGGTSRFWIGFDDKTTEGTYVWSDGTPFDYSFFSCSTTTLPKTGTEDCGNIVGSQGCWDDDDCSGHSFKYVCRAPHTPACP